MFSLGPSKLDALLRLVLEELPDPVVVIDSACRPVFSNRAARESRTEPARIRPLCQEQLGGCAAGCDPAVAPCVLCKAVLENATQKTLYRADGGDAHLYELTATPLALQDGRVLGGAAIVRDASERAQQERLITRARNEWQLTADSVPDLILLVGANRCVLRCNRAVREFTGREYSEIVGQDLHELLDGHCDLGALDGSHAEVRWRRPKALLELSRYPVPLEAGPSSEVWIFRDVTTLRRLEAIAGSVDMMNNMGHVLSGVRHELGNPVNSLKTALTVLLGSMEDFSAAKRHIYVRRCLDDVARIQVLLEQLRTFNGFESVSPSPVEILSTFDRIAALVREQVESLGVRLDCEIPFGPPVHVLADVRALQQVVLGLVANAVDAVACGEDPRIRVLAQFDEAQVTLVIEDNGVGIPKEELEFVFVPLFTTKPRGTGLGLAIARNMMARMNGTIELRSEQGRGTVVELSLTRLGSEPRPLDSTEALLSHVAWKGRLRAFVDGAGEMGSSSLVERDDACSLGSWIREGGAAYAQHPAYGELQNLHTAFHRAAARVVRAVECGRRSQARELLAPGSVYAVHSVGIVSAILRMGTAIGDWQRRLDLGFEPLDAHHQDLSILLVSLEEAARRSVPADEMGQLLMQLMAHATDHFLSEHELMRTLAYDRVGMEEHVEAHNYFLDQVRRLERACSLGKVEILTRTVERLRPWLVDHAQVHDAAVAREVRAQRPELPR